MNIHHPSSTTTQIEVLGVAPTVVDVAQLLKIDKSGVYRLLYAKRLERITGFGRTRICPKSVKRFLNRTGEHVPRGRHRPKPRTKPTEKLNT